MHDFQLYTSISSFLSVNKSPKLFDAENKNNKIDLICKSNQETDNSQKKYSNQSERYEKYMKEDR